ncbi:lysylphosphatidylglycerol synthase transmembrane domain-containing protein [Dendrosporobacter sp. 1207_IL3150]|uniref:lysylphosphatidylglycerol synthase transmembrane domain-containing protein n=1 Tax=Dendrosporobacter sp. 1207_IL3150 TaxID=3084054 RepID=UPI002FDA68A8
MIKIYQRLTVLIMLVLAISGAVIYFTVDINTLSHLNAFKPWSILAALFLLAIGLALDGTRLMHLVRISDERISFYEAIQVVFGNYFLALLTPGAAGGAVAQLMFLRRAGVPTGKATVLVIVRTLLSIVFLLLCMPIIFLFDQDLLPWISKKTMVLSSLIVAVVIIFAIWLSRTNLLSYLLVKLTRRFKYQRRRNIFSAYRDFQDAAFLLLKAPLCIFRVFIESALSLLALYSVVPILFIGMGIDINWHYVLGRMMLLNILLYFAPTPGGSGIAEGGFIMLFNDFLPSGTVGIAAVAWRIIVEYIPFIIGLYYTVKVFGRDFISKQL